MLRIAFAGTPAFAVPTLEALAASGHRLVGVLTQPDRPAGRGRHPRAGAVKERAVTLGLPVAQPEALGDDDQRAPLALWHPDVLVVVAYGLKLPRAVLGLPRLGCLNIHASLLPRWRGAAPIERAILAGDESSGVSIMQIDEGLDTGPLLAQRALFIPAQADAAELRTLLAALGARLLLETLEAVEAGQAQPRPQAAAGVIHAPKIDKREARIDWGRSALALARQVRAFSPWPVAETFWGNRRIRLWEARERQGAAATGDGLSATAPGTVLGMDDGALEVSCGEGVLRILRLQLEGRRPLTAAEFSRGQPLEGVRLA